MPSALSYRLQSTSSVNRDLEWQLEKAIIREALPNAIDNLRRSFQSAVDSLSDFLAISLDEERLKDTNEDEHEANSLVIIPHPIVGRAYHMPANRQDGCVVGGIGSRSTSARPVESRSEVEKDLDCSSTAQMPRIRRRAARVLVDEDAESNATLKEFGRRCGMLPPRGYGSVESEGDVSSKPRVHGMHDGQESG